MAKYYKQIIIVALFIWCAFQWVNNQELTDDISVQKEKVKAAEITIENLNLKISTLELDKEKLSGQVIILNSEITRTKSRILIIQKQRDEKINSIDNLTDAQLQQFFTDRYNSRSTK